MHKPHLQTNPSPLGWGMAFLTPRGRRRMWGPGAAEGGEEGGTHKRILRSWVTGKGAGSRDRKASGHGCFQDTHIPDSHTLIQDFDGWTTPPAPSSCSGYQPLHLSRLCSDTTFPEPTDARCSSRLPASSTVSPPWVYCPLGHSAVAWNATIDVYHGAPLYYLQASTWVGPSRWDLQASALICYCVQRED